MTGSALQFNSTPRVKLVPVKRKWSEPEDAGGNSETLQIQFGSDNFSSDENEVATSQKAAEGLQVTPEVNTNQSESDTNDVILGTQLDLNQTISISSSDPSTGVEIIQTPPHLPSSDQMELQAAEAMLNGLSGLKISTSDDLKGASNPTSENVNSKTPLKAPVRFPPSPFLNGRTLKIVKKNVCKIPRRTDSGLGRSLLESDYGRSHALAHARQAEICKLPTQNTETKKTISLLFPSSEVAIPLVPETTKLKWKCTKCPGAFSSAFSLQYHRGQAHKESEFLASAPYMEADRKSKHGKEMISEKVDLKKQGRVNNDVEKVDEGATNEDLPKKGKGPAAAGKCLNPKKGAHKCQICPLRYFIDEQSLAKHHRRHHHKVSLLLPRPQKKPSPKKQKLVS